MYTSLELSKKLAEVGFDEIPEQNFIYAEHNGSYRKTNELIHTSQINDNGKFRDTVDYWCYDILNDLCVKYAKVVWGDDWFVYTYCGGGQGNYWEGENIIFVLSLLQQGKQQEAEQYILENSILFNDR